MLAAQPFAKGRLIGRLIARRLIETDEQASIDRFSQPTTNLKWQRHTFDSQYKRRGGQSSSRRRVGATPCPALVFDHCPPDNAVHLKNRTNRTVLAFPSHESAL
ncbi:hypothetical protein CIW54_05160 [Paraburkholderia sp. T12-10]|nr:hypothetical protein CIW54_05160 [Paraburkholderia sp. T12-10]